MVATNHNVLETRRVMDELRNATRLQHRALDQDPCIAARFQTKQGLAHILGRWYGFLVPYEAYLGNVAGELSNVIASRKKTPFLRADLKIHGIQLEQLSECSDVPRPSSQAEILGAMYVTEGSTLGGRFLSRHIESTLGLSNNAGYSFFNAYGAQTGARWKEFGNIVELACSRDLGITIGAAQQTFASIHNWLVAE